jgi:hypothetical protein
MIELTRRQKAVVAALRKSSTRAALEWNPWREVYELRDSRGRLVDEIGSVKPRTVDVLMATGLLIKEERPLSPTRYVIKEAE